MKNLHKAAFWILFDFRTWIGMALLRRALRVLPATFSVREGIERGIAEQIEYERYAGYTMLCGVSPWTFERWREERKWLRTRRPNPCIVADRSRLYTVREFAL